MHISDCCQFSDIHISQGSVATYLRRGGIFKHDFVANLPLCLPVKEFWKSINIWGSYGREFSVLFFLRHSVYEYTYTYPPTQFNHCFPGKCWLACFLMIPKGCLVQINGRCLCWCQLLTETYPFLNLYFSASYTHRSLYDGCNDTSTQWKLCICTAGFRHCRAGRSSFTYSSVELFSVGVKFIGESFRYKSLW